MTPETLRILAALPATAYEAAQKTDLDPALVSRTLIGLRAERRVRFDAGRYEVEPSFARALVAAEKMVAFLTAR